MTIDTHALTMAANAVIQEANRITSTAEAIEAARSVAPQAVRAMLDELADAEADCSEHFQRYQSESGRAYKNQSAECRDDWSRCYDRRDAAIRAVTKYAQTTRSDPLATETLDNETDARETIGRLQRAPAKSSKKAVSP